MMKAYEINEFGIDNLALVERTAPESQARDMKVLIVHAHNEPKSFSSALARRAAKTLMENEFMTGTVLEVDGGHRLV